MSFLAPWFLLGAAAITLPVVFHLIRRNTRQRTLFSSLLFLQPTPPRMRQRSRLEDLLLLALRCAVIGLLAFGFSRPFLRRESAADPAPAQSRRYVILVDTSASMRRPGLWDAALDRVRSALATLTPADQAAVFAFARETTPLVSFEAWNAAPPGSRSALALERLRATGPGWAATHLDQALIQAADLLLEGPEDPAPDTRRIVLVTDLQEGARLERLQAYDWPKGIPVDTPPLLPHRPGNAGLQVLTDNSPVAGVTNAVVRVRVQNEAEARNDRFDLRWFGAAAGTSPAPPAVETRVAPGGSRVVRLEVPGATGPDRLTLEGDTEDFDNTVFLVPPVPGNARLLYLGAESPADAKEPLYFLRRAFPGTNQAGIHIDTRSPASPVPAPELSAAGLILAGAGLTPDLADLLHRQARDEGRTVLCVVRGPDSAVALARLLGVPSVAVEEARPAQYAMLGELDLRHPLLAPFADPRFGDFTRIRIWKYRKIALDGLPGLKVPIRFDSGDPALAELAVGRGRVLVLATGWHPADSQLALSSKFVPLLVSMLETGGSGPRSAPAGLAVGEPFPLSEPATEGASVLRPDGSRVPLAAGSTRVDATDTPGIYTVTPGPGARPVRFAVNLDPSESRTRPLAWEDLEHLGVRIRSTPESAPTPAGAERTRQLAAAEAEGRQKLWRWALAATCLILLLETALAGWMTRPAASSEGAPV